MNRLGRRTVLRGMGALIPLPLLEANLGRSLAQAADELPPRWAMFYFPNGCYQSEWTCAAAPDGAVELPEFLQPALGAVRDDLVWINGLANGQRGKGDHETASATYLNGQPMVNDGPVLERSVDQHIAEVWKDEYSLPSLTLSADGFRQGAGCCRDVEVALNHISWQGGTTPTTKVQSPHDLFERLFPSGNTPEEHRLAEERRARRRSVLDFARAQIQRLRPSLSNNDAVRMDAYLHSVREVERQLETSVVECAAPEQPALELSFEEHNSRMFDLLFVAFQCGLTPTATFMMDFEFSGRRLNIPNVNTSHHLVSHHGEAEPRIRQYRLIQAFYASRFADFVERMKSTQDVDSNSLLDNSLLILGSGLSDGNSHTKRELPTVVAGTAGGRITPGRVIDANRRLSSLWRTSMRLMGVSDDVTDAFGDGDIDLPELLS